MRESAESFLAVAAFGDDGADPVPFSFGGADTLHVFCEDDVFVVREVWSDESLPFTIDPLLESASVAGQTTTTQGWQARIPDCEGDTLDGLEESDLANVPLKVDARFAAAGDPVTFSVVAHGRRPGRGVRRRAGRRRRDPRRHRDGARRRRSRDRRDGPVVRRPVRVRRRRCRSGCDRRLLGGRPRRSAWAAGSASSPATRPAWAPAAGRARRPLNSKPAERPTCRRMGRRVGRSPVWPDRAALASFSRVSSPRPEREQAPVERVIGRGLEEAQGVGKPLAERTRQRRRTVEAYLKGGSPPRWMERIGDIDRGIAEQRRRLERAHRILAEECGDDRARFARSAGGRWRPSGRSTGSTS